MLTLKALIFDDEVKVKIEMTTRGDEKGNLPISPRWRNAGKCILRDNHILGDYELVHVDAEPPKFATHYYQMRQQFNLTYKESSNGNRKPT
jgi:hypothetical protein